MTINVNVAELKALTPRILVMGVGGAGGNAINGMIDSGLQGVEFVAVNTDAQDLTMNKATAKIQLGANLTRGLGAGAQIDIGQASADESLNEIINYLQGSNMVFITAGMGGGTGTGAAHVIARAAKELNILTVGVVTLPFLYEGPSRMNRALKGLDELKKHVDTNIVVPNQNLFKIANEKTTFEESFDLSNRVLKHGVQSITDLMVRPGLINLDFADVETVMKGMGKAMMGTGESDGEDRANKAADLALNNPLIDEYSLRGAKGLLVNITGGKDLTLFEVDQAVNKVRAEVDTGAELIIGAITDTNLEGKMRVSIVATALDGQVPDTKSVVSMIHRINNRNYVNNSAPNGSSNVVATQGHEQVLFDGATALDLNTGESLNNQQAANEIVEPSITNIAVEDVNALTNTLEKEPNTFVQNEIKAEVNSAEYIANETEKPENSKVFKEESTPKLFSEDENITAFSEDGDNEKSPEMFKEYEIDEDLEIPAFLRRQKN